LTSDSVALQSILEVPKGWSNVGATAPKGIGARASDTWITGVAIPSRVAAGRYVVRGKFIANRVEVSDSIAIVIDQRREIEVLPIEAPSWSLAGRDYQAAFLVRNLGNVPTRVSMRAKATLGANVEATPPSAYLYPGGSIRVMVRTTSARKIMQTSDDVV